MSKIRDLPLRYRLSIPFFFLALVGTCALVGLAIHSQNKIIRQQERDRLFGNYRAFDHNLELRGQWAVSLASNFARNPEIASALAERNRLKLIELCYPSYIFMKKHYGVSQFHFQVLPSRSFLRLHRLYEYGDDLSYRKIILDAIEQRKEVYGLEKGLSGLGIRGVSPVYYHGKMVGTIEVGLNLGATLLEQMKKQFDIEASFLLPESDGSLFHSSATTFPAAFDRSNPVYRKVFSSGTPAILLRLIGNIPFAVLVGALQDYQNRTVALVELCVNREKTLSVIGRYRQLMIGIGILGMILSVGGIYIISSYFTRPIAKMVKFAREIALGHRVEKLDIQPSGEFGVLANALNEMITALNESQKKINEYMDNLEHMVHLRTRALRESEEKYRTLVENVPLVVYRLLGDGKMIFINHFIEDLMGITAEEALTRPNFWREKVWVEDRERIWPLMDRCLREGLEFKAEYRVQHASGKLIFVQGHALPILDEKGDVEIVDGFLFNVTDRHRLQQQIIQTEELKTLSEVSARLAHEIRNPLVAAGGFARRLLQSMSEGDPNREKVQIIVQEVARLEKVLEKTLAYIKPFEVLLERMSLNEVVEEVIVELNKQLGESGVQIEARLSSNLPLVSLDRHYLKRGIESLLKAMLDYCERGKNLLVRTYPGEYAVYLEMKAHVVRMSEDDIEHFFYPFTTRLDPSKALDLPLAKMIIHKHQGLIEIEKKNDHLILSISFPV